MTDAVVEAPASPTPPTVVQKVVAEVVGTFVLVLVGCGAVVYAKSSDSFTIVGTALAFGLAVLVMAYAVGRVSGGHFNPAVSVAAALGGRMSWREVPVYVGAQVVGAILGAGTLLLLLQGYEFYSVDRVGLGQNSFGDVAGASGYAWWAAFLLEMVLTAVFVLVILAVTDARNENPALAPLAIGLTLTAVHLVAIPATGTSVNPARSIGPAIFSGSGDAVVQLWLFILAPLLGGAISGLLYPAIFGRAGEPVPGSGLRFPTRPATATLPADAASDQYQQQWNQQVWSGEPIIQDGWQWDPYAQQWIPAPQQDAGPPAPPESTGGDADGGHTQIRPQ